VGSLNPFLSGFLYLSGFDASNGYTSTHVKSFLLLGLIYRVTGADHQSDFLLRLEEERLLEWVLQLKKNACMPASKKVSLLAVSSSVQKSNLTDIDSLPYKELLRHLVLYRAYRRLRDVVCFTT
jgi:hypothetical protein